jgi:hypothetical protein
MNPLGLIILGLGIIMFIIGFKGSQHEVVDAFVGIRGGTPAKTTASTTVPVPTGAAAVTAV